MMLRRSTVLWALFAVIAVVSSILVMQRPPSDRLSDLHIYLGAAQTVQTGRPLYGYVAENGGPFTYPPFAVLVLRPLIAFPEHVARVMWLALTCAAIAAIAAAVRGELTRRPHQVAVAAAACVLMISAPAQSNLRFGQVSVLIVLLALIDGVRLTPARYRGILVGLAAAIKLTPLLFVVYFLIARRRRDAARAVATFVACAALGAIVLPADSWTYWSGMMLQTSRIGNLASLGNQSVHGMLLRVGVDHTTLPVLWAGLVVIICAAALLRARRVERDGQPVRAAVLVGCATVAASPVSWTHHQIWTVLAAMLMIAAHGTLRRVAGVVLLLSMILSLGRLLRGISTFPGVQFLLENARALGVVGTCLAGCGTIAIGAAMAGRRGVGTARRRLRAGVAAAATLSCFAVLPLPAGADPTFKAYTLADAHNPRYFFFCNGPRECAERASQTAIDFGVVREKTKVRVNGVVDDSVRRLTYQSAPGGAPRNIPLVEIYPAQRAFSFRSANLVHGRLVAYGAGDEIIATFTEFIP